MCLYNQVLADVRSTGAGIKCLYCSVCYTYFRLFLYPDISRYSFKIVLMRWKATWSCWKMSGAGGGGGGGWYIATTMCHMNIE